MKHFTLCLSAFILSACMNEQVTPAQFLNLQAQFNQQQARLQQLEQQQQQLRGRLEEVAQARLVPLGAAAAVTQRPSESAYQAALHAYRAGQVEQAIQTFNAFLSEGATGEEALQAHYWLGDAYYTQRQYEMALRYWGELLRQAPEHARVPVTIQKMTEAYRQMGRVQEAEMLQQHGIEALQP